MVVGVQEQYLDILTKHYDSESTLRVLLNKSAILVYVTGCTVITVYEKYTSYFYTRTYIFVCVCMHASCSWLVSTNEAIPSMPKCGTPQNTGKSPIPIHTFKTYNTINPDYSSDLLYSIGYEFHLRPI